MPDDKQQCPFLSNEKIDNGNGQSFTLKEMIVSIYNKLEKVDERTRKNELKIYTIYGVLVFTGLIIALVKAI